MASTKNNDNEAKASLAPIIIGIVVVIAVGIIFGIKNYQSHTVNATQSLISTESEEKGDIFTEGTNSGNSGNGSGSNGGSHTKPDNGVIPGMEGLSDTSIFDDPYNR